jgi:hypothetical protein
MYHGDSPSEWTETNIDKDKCCRYTESTVGVEEMFTGFVQKAQAASWDR